MVLLKQHRKGANIIMLHRLSPEPKTEREAETTYVQITVEVLSMYVDGRSLTADTFTCPPMPARRGVQVYNRLIAWLESWEWRYPELVSEMRSAFSDPRRARIAVKGY